MSALDPKKAWLAAHLRLLAAKAAAPAVPGWAEHTLLIADVLTAYAAHYDAGDIDGMLDQFEPDAEYSNVFWTCTGHDELRESLKPLVARYERSCHFVVNSTIWVKSATSASAVSYLHAVVQTHDGVSYALGASYQDELGQRDGRWRIRRRNVVDGLAYRVEAIDPALRLPPLGSDQ